MKNQPGLTSLLPKIPHRFLYRIQITFVG